MSKQSVFCIVTSPEQANRIVDQLETSNFPGNISVLYPAGELSGLGLPAAEAKGARTGAAGNILISVTTGTLDEIARLRNICAQAGAPDIFIAGEASASKGSVPIKDTELPAVPTMAAYSGSGA